MKRARIEPTPDQRGKTVLITGGNSGIGLETARMFVQAGATVVIACRDRERGETAVQRLNAGAGPGSAQLLALDLASLASVRQGVQRFTEQHGRLDILINNAGVMAIPRLLSADGFEMQMAVNHFGHFALTGLLLESGLRAFPARIVTVTSALHWRGQIRLDDLDLSCGYDRWLAYAQSKLANLLFSLELGRRLQARGTSTLSVACHPGYASTNLHLVAPALRGSRLDRAVHRISYALFAQTAADGARTSLHAATAPGLTGGDCIGPSGWLQLRGAPAKVRYSPKARDPQLAERLWAVSVERTGVGYTVLEPAHGVAAQSTDASRRTEEV
jgi:NAD(P)-dependent dehydrogenase (short-subunit alcohol dehydrogenase family)